jgi:3-hydroxyisobutyrate dehydrogenase
MADGLRVAFLGLGVIGRGMVGNLMKKWPDLTVWNRTPKRAEPFAAAGARVAASAAEAADGAGVVCVCVSDTPDVESVVFGPGGAAEGLRSGSVLIDFSTICPERTRAFAAKLAGQGAEWLDAPVTGGDVGARNGTLTIMVGGREEAFAKALPVLETVGRKVVRMGDCGMGQQTKLVNQVAVMGTLASMGEAMNFAREKGLDVAQVLDVIASGAAGSWSMANYGPRVLAGDFAPGFALALMAKDLRIVRESLKGCEADYAVVERLATLVDRMVAEGHGGDGLHSIVKAMGWRG